MEMTLLRKFCTADATPDASAGAAPPPALVIDSMSATAMGLTWGVGARARARAGGAPG